MPWPKGPEGETARVILATNIKRLEGEGKSPSEALRIAKRQVEKHFGIGKKRKK